MSAATPEGSPWRGQGFLLGLATLLALAAFLMVWPYKAAVVFALILGYLLTPLYKRLHRRLRWRPVAGSIVLLLVALLLVVPFFVIGASLVEEGQSVGRALRDGTARTQAEGVLVQFGIPSGEAGATLERITTAAGERLQGFAVDALVRTVDFLFSLLVFFILLYFVLTDGERLVGYLRRVSPLDRLRTDRVLARTGENTRAILLGSILVYVIQGVVAGLGWWIFGFPQPLFWGFVMTVLAVLPFAGPFFILLPASIIALVQGDLVGGIGLLVWAIVLVGLIDDVVRPWIIGRKSGVHPAIILLGIVGGIALFGAVGFVLGPLLLSLLGPVIEAYVRPENEPLRPKAEE